MPTEYELSLDAFHKIVREAADRTEREVQRRVQSGVFSPLRLCFRTGELLLVESMDLTIPDGFTDSGRELPMNVPYSQYFRWIENNSRDLAIL